MEINISNLKKIKQSLRRRLIGLALGTPLPPAYSLETFKTLRLSKHHFSEYKREQLRHTRMEILGQKNPGVCTSFT